MFYLTIISHFEVIISNNNNWNNKFIKHDLGTKLLFTIIAKIYNIFAYLSISYDLLKLLIKLAILCKICINRIYFCYIVDRVHNKLMFIIDKSYFNSSIKWFKRKGK